MDERSIEEFFHARGMRMTGPRRRIFAAVRELGHATPDAIAEAVERDGGDPLPLSTVYRTLDALAELGLVAHTHLGHGSPTYHLVDHATHVHLVCLGCGGVADAPLSVAAELAANVRSARDFEADIKHMVVHGWCRECRSERAEEDA